jgi:hypothetical protein
VEAFLGGCVTLGLRNVFDNRKEDRPALAKLLVFKAAQVSANSACKPTDPGCVPLSRAVATRFQQQIVTAGHHWFDRSTNVVVERGRPYDLTQRLHRQQLALNTIRLMQRAAAVVTTDQFHVLMPGPGLGVPALSLSWPPLAWSSLKSQQNDGSRTAGLTGLFQHLHSRSDNAEEGGTAMHILLRQLERRRGLPDAAEHLRGELVSGWRWALSKHRPLLDAMHRLGAIDPGSSAEEIALADEAWLLGLPLGLHQNGSRSGGPTTFTRDATSRSRPDVCSPQLVSM